MHLTHRNFAFLDNIQKEFVKMYRKGRIRTANAYALDKNFLPTMRSSMHYHNIHHKELRQEEKVMSMLAQVQDIRDVMGRNLQLILERGEKFDGILAKSEKLNEDANVFRKKSRAAKRMMQRKYYFWFVVFAVVLLAFLYIVVMGVCGAGLKRCRASDNSGSSGNQSNNNGGGGEEEGDGNNRLFVF